MLILECRLYQQRAACVCVCVGFGMCECAPARALACFITSSSDVWVLQVFVKEAKHSRWINGSDTSTEGCTV